MVSYINKSTKKFIIDKKDVEKIIRSGEGDQLEFKLDVANPRIIAKTISAFANTNGGLILFGIDDTGKIVGITEPNRFESYIRSAINELDPTPDNYGWNIISKGNKKLGILYINQSSLNIKLKDILYKRVGASTIQLTKKEFILSNEDREKPVAVESNQLMMKFLSTADEDAFTEVMLVPFLRQLGFKSVIFKGHRDRTLEFGQDLKIFKYQLPTGHWLYFAAQVKTGKIKYSGSNKNKNIENILTQLRMAFESEIFDIETNTQTLPDHIFFISTGSIAEGARKYLHQTISREKNRRIIIWEGQYILERIIEKGLPTGCQIDVKRYLESNSETVDI